MGLMQWLGFDKRERDSEREELRLVPPPFATLACTCGSRAFTAGGPSVSAEANGVTARTTPQGAVLSCLQCGKRWYTTPEGLREPHRDALPPTWAAMDMQREAVEQRAQRVADSNDGANAPKRPIATEFRRPPRGPRA